MTTKVEILKALPQDAIADIERIIDYLWDDERKHYQLEGHPADGSKHIFFSLANVRDSLDPAPKSEVERYMWVAIGDHFFDKTTNEVMRTGLAEETALAFHRDYWLDDETHWVWQMAHDVAEEYERSLTHGGA